MEKGPEITEGAPLSVREASMKFIDQKVNAFLKSISRQVSEPGFWSGAALGTGIVTLGGLVHRDVDVAFSSGLLTGFFTFFAIVDAKNRAYWEQRRQERNTQPKQ